MHFSKSHRVVIDGYTNTAYSTICAETLRPSAAKSSVDINSTEEMVVTVEQEHFLGKEK